MENHKTESKAVKFLLIGISVLFLFVMLVLPLFVVVTEALKKGWQVYIEAVTEVPAGLLFGSSAETFCRRRSI